MRVGVVLAGAVVSITAGGLVRSKLLQPNLVIVMEPVLVIVDEDGRGNVHGVDQTKTFADAALANEFFDLRRDVDESTPRRNFKPKMFGQRFQCFVSTVY